MLLVRTRVGFSVTREGSLPVKPISNHEYLSAQTPADLASLARLPSLIVALCAHSTSANPSARNPLSAHLLLKRVYCRRSSLYKSAMYLPYSLEELAAWAMKPFGAFIYSPLGVAQNAYPACSLRVLVRADSSCCCVVSF